MHTALREIGIDLDKIKTVKYVLKEDFKHDELYKSGYVFVNERQLIDRHEVKGLLPSVKEHPYSVKLFTGASGEDIIMEEGVSDEKKAETFTCHTTIKEISDINYAIVHKALCKYNVFKFNILKSYFPNLGSTREFIKSEDYLGDIKLDITSRYKEPTPQVLFYACVNVLGKISEKVSSIQETYEGTKDFTAKYIHDVFRDKTCNYNDPHDGGIGISQNDWTVKAEWKIDLSKEDWFVFEDNYGTSEEKAFVAYFKTYVDNLKDKYDKVYLIRNERQLVIYSFDGGERFEPDYLLFLHSPKQEGYEQLQVFIEPKGNGYIDKDIWKEEFLLQLESNAVPVIKFADDNKYKIWGFHFFNQDFRMSDFSDDMARL